MDLLTASVWGGFGSLLLRRPLELNPTPLHFGASGRNCFAGKKTLQGVFQVGMAGLWPFGAVSEAIVNGAPVKYRPGFGFDADGFCGSRCAQRTRHQLGMVQEDGEVNAKVPSLLADGGRIVLGVGIDEPENHAFRPKLIAQRL